MSLSNPAVRTTTNPIVWQVSHIEGLRANHSLPDIPATITDQAGLKMRLNEESWRFNCGPDNCVVTWKLKSPLLLESIKQYVLNRVVRVSARSGQNAASTITILLESCPSLVRATEAKDLEEYSQLLVDVMNEVAFSLRQGQRFWRYFYLSDWYKWCFRHHPELGFDSDFCDYLESIRIPANPSGEAVRSGDPMKGPLDFELETKPLIAALLHDKSNERRHLNQKLAVALSLAFGRNSLNFRLLTENDFIPSASSSSQEGGVLRIPRIKKRRLYREVFTDEPIETFLSDLIRQVIASNQSVCTTVSLTDARNADPTPLLRPLFMRESPRKKILNSADYMYSFFMNRLELQNLLRDFVERHQIYSPVTQSLLHLSFRRLRYTLATDAALSGTSIQGLALLLDQTGTQTARVYINASGRIVFILEQAAEGRIDSMLQFFEDCVDSSASLPPDNDGNVQAEMPPLSCYRCPLFTPFDDCNHDQAIRALGVQLNIPDHTKRDDSEKGQGSMYRSNKGEHDD
jgi:hypothetical protein